MKTKIYCLASAKGGSGKTVLSASFAAFLANLGKKVLIIDLDVATYGLTLLYLNEVKSHLDEIAASKNESLLQGIFDTGEFSWERNVVQLPNGVSLIPATFSFSIKEYQSAIDLKMRLKKILIRAAEELFDYIFLDAQAGTDGYSQVAMSIDIANEVVIVSEYDPLSAAGVERLKALLRDELLYERTWMLLNKMLPEFVSTFSEFLEVNKYLTPIPWDADVVRAYARRRLPLDLKYGNSFTLAVMQSLKKLLGEDLSSEIDKWAEGRASSIREPIEKQYFDAETELKGLIEQKHFQESKLARKKLLYKVIATMVPLIAITMSFPLWFHTEYRLDSSRDSIFFSYIIPILTVFIVIFAVYFSSREIIPWIKSAEQEVEEARFMRQVSIVEDRLKKLEVLRKADLKTLVSEAKNQK